MELEARECPCGLTFKCLPTSLQKFHARNCQVNFEKISFGWTAAARKKREKREENIKTPITSAIILGENVKRIALGERNTESTKENMPDASEPKIPKDFDCEIENTNLTTERNAVHNEVSSEKPLYSESDEEIDLENLDDYTPINSEKPSRIGIINTIRQQRSIQQQEISEKEFYHSKSLVDESIGQLQELTKLCVTSLHSQDAKHRDPQMVNSAVNSAKAITELIKIKLTAAKLLNS